MVVYIYAHASKIVSSESYKNDHIYSKSLFGSSLYNMDQITLQTKIIYNIGGFESTPGGVELWREDEEGVGCTLVTSSLQPEVQGL